MISAFLTAFYIILAVFLSITAFKGGVHLAYYRFLKRLIRLNEAIAKTDDIYVLFEYEQFLKKMNAKNEDITFKDWLKFGFLGKD